MGRKSHRRAVIAADVLPYLMSRLSRTPDGSIVATYMLPQARGRCINTSTPEVYPASRLLPGTKLFPRPGYGGQDGSQRGNIHTMPMERGPVFAAYQVVRLEEA